MSIKILTYTRLIIKKKKIIITDLLFFIEKKTCFLINTLVYFVFISIEILIYE